VAAHHAVVHDDIESGRSRAPGGGFIDDTVLEPDRARPDRDRVVDDGAREL
jgi:hypothetical protein